MLPIKACAIGSPTRSSSITTTRNVGSQNPASSCFISPRSINCSDAFSLLLGSSHTPHLTASSLIAESACLVSSTMWSMSAIDAANGPVNTFVSSSILSTFLLPQLRNHLTEQQHRPDQLMQHRDCRPGAQLTQQLGPLLPELLDAHGHILPWMLLAHAHPGEDGALVNRPLLGGLVDRCCHP